GNLGAALAERLDPEARSRLKVCEIGTMVFLEASLPGVFRALFTTRIGGESKGVFSSLNLDPRSEDEPAAVSHNRSRVGAVVGSAGTDDNYSAGPRLVSPAQVHGLRVAGAAEYVRHDEGGPCDGLTLHPLLDRGLAALLLFADCVPVVLAGEVDVAVAHAGWRGILGGIVQQAGLAMTGAPGMAVIGPSIGPCCFTVGEELAAAFSARFGPQVVVTEGPPGRGLTFGSRGEGRRVRAAGPRLDLWAAITKALEELGIAGDRVVNPRLCTACNVDLFYSYRVEGPVTGRHGCVAWASSTSTAS
ncbi:MAG: polyphenol oxidase family protein, partial [bacterium]